MITILPILPFILIISVLLFFIIRNSDRKQLEDTENFFDRERKSKLVRPVDLESLPYLNIPVEKLGFGEIDDTNIKKLEEDIVELSKKPLLNLTRKTNTELREIYGAPNLEAMKAIGDDFDKLTVLLSEYGKALIDSGHINEAIPVLEYGMFIKSDVSTTYTLLADCFYERGQKRRLETLRDEVTKLEILMRGSIISYIDKLIGQLDSKDAPEDITTSL